MNLHNLLKIRQLLLISRILGVLADSGMREIHAFAVKIRPPTTGFMHSTIGFAYSPSRLVLSTTGFRRSTTRFAHSTKSLVRSTTGFRLSTKRLASSTPAFAQWPENFGFCSFRIADSPGRFFLYSARMAQFPTGLGWWIAVLGWRTTSGLRRYFATFSHCCVFADLRTASQTNCVSSASRKVGLAGLPLARPSRKSAS